MKKYTYEKDTLSELLLLPNLYGFMEDCDVYFENAGLHAVVDTYGRVAFADKAGNILAEKRLRLIQRMTNIQEVSAGSETEKFVCFCRLFA